jgi:hypothetical protein
LNQAVGKCGFAMVNMSDDAKVSNVFHNFKTMKMKKPS